jgi:hypothetical protein
LTCFAIVFIFSVLLHPLPSCRRSAEQLMGGGEEGDGEEADEATTAAVCLALDLSSLLQGLEEGSHLWTITLGEAGALTVKPLSAAADTPQPAGAGTADAAGAAVAATTPGGSRNRKRRPECTPSSGRRPGTSSRRAGSGGRGGCSRRPGGAVLYRHAAVPLH